jgi:hypothetical protein
VPVTDAFADLLATLTQPAATPASAPGPKPTRASGDAEGGAADAADPQTPPATDQQPPIASLAMPAHIVVEMVANAGDAAASGGETTAADRWASTTALPGLPQAGDGSAELSGPAVGVDPAPGQSSATPGSPVAVSSAADPAGAEAETAPEMPPQPGLAGHRAAKRTERGRSDVHAAPAAVEIAPTLANGQVADGLPLHRSATPGSAVTAAPVAPEPAIEADAAASGDRGPASGQAIVEPEGAPTVMAEASGEASAAAPAAPTTELPPSVQIGMQVGRGRGGAETITVSLSPVELGGVEVSLELDEGGRMRAHVAVERQATLELIQRDAPQLERALQAAGIDLAPNALSFDLRQDGQSAPERHPASSQPPIAPRQPPVAAEAEPQPQPARAATRLLDLSV